MADEQEIATTVAPEPPAPSMNSTDDVLEGLESLAAFAQGGEAAASAPAEPQSVEPPDTVAAVESTMGQVDEQLAELESMLEAEIPPVETPALESAAETAETPPAEAQAAVAVAEEADAPSVELAVAVEPAAELPSPAPLEADNPVTSHETAYVPDAPPTPTYQAAAAPPNPVPQATETATPASQLTVAICGLVFAPVVKLLIVLDVPFRGIGLGVKRGVGYAAWATLFMAGVVWLLPRFISLPLSSSH